VCRSNRQRYFEALAAAGGSAFDVIWFVLPSRFTLALQSGNCILQFSFPKLEIKLC
jgi:hypothetical protein